MHDQEVATRLEKRMVAVFCRKTGIFSQIDTFGLAHAPNMLRWAIMPFFYALVVAAAQHPKPQLAS